MNSEFWSFARCCIIWKKNIYRYIWLPDGRVYVGNLENSYRSRRRVSARKQPSFTRTRTGMRIGMRMRMSKRKREGGREGCNCGGFWDAQRCSRRVSSGSLLESRANYIPPLSPTLHLPSLPVTFPIPRSPFPIAKNRGKVQHLSTYLYFCTNQHRPRVILLDPPQPRENLIWERHRGTICVRGYGDRAVNSNEQRNRAA